MLKIIENLVGECDALADKEFDNIKYPNPVLRNLYKVEYKRGFIKALSMITKENRFLEVIKK